MWHKLISSLYIKKIDNSEKNINAINNTIKELKEKFNYYSELNNLKTEIELLKNQLKMSKKGQFKMGIADILKGIIVIILVYVAIQVFISLSK